MSQTAEPTRRTPLRLWPGVLAAVLLAVVRYVVPLVVPGSGGVAILGGLAGALIVGVWWLLFSRAPWSERLGGLAVMAIAALATWPFLHESIRNGMMGLMFTVYLLPILGLALVAWAAVSRRFSPWARRASMLAAIVLACGGFTLLRTEGITGDADSEFEWRWTPTPEELLLARVERGPAPLPPAPVPAETPDALAPSPTSGGAVAPAPSAAPTLSATRTPDREMHRPVDPGSVKRLYDWPGFRGASRDGVVRGILIETNWSSKPPTELWRRPIGPGWSSFAVYGDLIYTQEQRGAEEVVSSYRLSDGLPVWQHRDPVRFWESNGGAGPRATPAVHDGRVYTLGATGIANALDARTGAIVWSRNAAADTGATLPGWGFAGSPLVVRENVIVAASGRLAAYHAASGALRWTRTTVGGGYSSPHLARIGGVEQIVLLSGGGASGIAPADGSVLWEHKWEQGENIVQPAMTDNGEVLIGGVDMGGSTGLRRIALSHGHEGWAVQERWTTRGLKPYFNDFVVHKGHAFGFDGSILSCIDLENGERRWKGGRYGHGQMILLASQDVLLVLSEDGELALVGATPDRFTELARVKAIEGKTWNHPVLVTDILLVRNGEEMVAFRLAVAGK